MNAPECLESLEPAGLSRRRFLERAGLALIGGVGGAGCVSLPRQEGRFRGDAFAAPVAVATWKHGLPAVKEAASVLASGGTPLDAVERGINTAEVDPEVSSVGVGGLPNAEGVVQLDAAIMDGAGLRCGSVLALEEIATPISVARRVMERTRHIQLAQAGAQRFALAQGFERQPLLTDASRGAWERWKASPERTVPGQVSRSRDRDDHDTIGMVALGASGRMAAGCSTSGLAWKIPGRVGDSPIIGAGLYCDGDVGGASATGIGEEVIRVCGSFLVVELMRRGASPQEAVEEVLRRIVRVQPDNRQRQVAFIALSRRGEVGAGSIRPGFQVAIHSGPRFSLADTWSLEGGISRERTPRQ